MLEELGRLCFGSSGRVFVESQHEPRRGHAACCISKYWNRLFFRRLGQEIMELSLMNLSWQDRRRAQLADYLVCSSAGYKTLVLFDCQWDFAREFSNPPRVSSARTLKQTLFERDSQIDHQASIGSAPSQDPFRARLKERWPFLQSVPTASHVPPGCEWKVGLAIPKPPNLLVSLRQQFNLLRIEPRWPSTCREERGALTGLLFSEAGTHISALGS